MKSKNGFFTKTDGWQYKIKKGKESTQPVTLNYAPPQRLVQKRHPPWFHKMSDYCTKRKEIRKMSESLYEALINRPHRPFSASSCNDRLMTFDKSRQKSDAVKAHCICCDNAQYNMSDLASFVSYFFLERIKSHQRRRKGREILPNISWGQITELWARNHVSHNFLHLDFAPTR